MASDIKGCVGITLDRERNLRYDENAVADFEGATQQGFFAFLAKFQDGGDKGGGPLSEGAVQAAARLEFRDIRAFLWAGLAHEDPSLTVRKVGELMGRVPGTMMERLTYCLGRAMEAATLALGGPEKNAVGAPTIIRGPGA